MARRCKQEPRIIWGEDFAKGFGIQFQDVDGERKYAWTTSWGASTRLIGGVIMVHGDESGLQMPPRVAPIQVAIVPIWRKEPEREVVAEAVAGLEAQLRRARRAHPYRLARRDAGL